MICAPAAARPAFLLGVRERNDRECSEDGADDHISEKGGAKSLSFRREEPQRGRPEGENSMSLRDGAFRKCAARNYPQKMALT